MGILYADLLDDDDNNKVHPVDNGVPAGVGTAHTDGNNEVHHDADSDDDSDYEPKHYNNSTAASAASSKHSEDNYEDNNNDASSTEENNANNAYEAHDSPNSRPGTRYEHDEPDTTELDNETKHKMQEWRGHR